MSCLVTYGCCRQACGDKAVLCGFNIVWKEAGSRIMWKLKVEFRMFLKLKICNKQQEVSYSRTVTIGGYKIGEIKNQPCGNITTLIISTW